MPREDTETGMAAQSVLDVFPLTPIQQGMLFHYLRDPRSGVDFEQIVGTLDERVNPRLLERAWNATAQRHGALRCRLRWEGVAAPVQEVLAEAPLTVVVADWRETAADEREQRFARWLEEDRARGTRLDEAPLHRLTLLQFGPEAWRLVWSFPHVVVDGRSFATVLDDVFACYDALRGGRAPATEPGPRFGAHVEWLRSREPADEESFWRRYLRGFSTPTPLPFGRPADAPRGGGGPRGERETTLSEPDTSALRTLAERTGVSLGTVVQGAWALVLSRASSCPEVVFGAARAGRKSSIPDADRIVGTFVNTLPQRVVVPPDAPLADWLRELGARLRETAVREHTPLVDILRWADVRSGTPLFETLVVYDHASLDRTMTGLGQHHARRRFRLHERTSYPLTLYAYGEPSLLLRIAHDEARLDSPAAECVLRCLATALRSMPGHADRRVGDLPLVPDEERRSLAAWNATARNVRASCVHDLVAEQAARTPQAVAVVSADQRLTYAELDERSNRLARYLRGLGVGPNVPVALGVERSLDMVVGLLGILKAGGAYVPLDPAYPAERLQFYLEDSGAPVLLTQHRLVGDVPRTPAARVVCLDADWPAIAAQPAEPPLPAATPADLAYLIYTSGSTGRPKGVMVEHRNVVNFFSAMDERLGDTDPGTWLAVTSLSFDISVLELVWPLTRGFTVVIHAEEGRFEAAPLPNAHRGVAFSLFYFSADERGHGAEKYRLLLDGARFADEHGFAAVWTPERHFHAFGALYPNPAVTGAALAAITDRVQIRAGSCVLPLHHPVRVAEEWAVVDNLSNGRVGLSVASGWQPNDFVLRPENFADARAAMQRDIETVRKLWRGETVVFPGPRGDVPVRTMPRPVQPELPLWITAAGTPATFEAAGRLGAGVLTHLLGQSIADVAANVTAYRRAWKEAGHPGEGCVSLMLHTFVGDDDAAVKTLVKEPMKQYLRTSLSLIKGHARDWSAFKKRADGTSPGALDMDALTPEELDALLDYSFERYYETSGLFGTLETCARLVDRLKGIGVDDIACLIDFGVAPETVLAHLPHLDRLRRRVGAPRAAPGDHSIPALIARHRVTHLQCTPSMASVLLADPRAKDALRDLRVLCIGGEAFPVQLAEELRQAASGNILNMYGPTETTIWSTSHRLDGPVGPGVPIGRPLANTELYIVDGHGEPVPIGAAGELLIGGAGVVRGYHRLPGPTADRFVPNRFRADHGSRLYRTGDLARYRPDGALEFLGRLDQQVKLRGYRIELGEIEARIAEHAGVREVVVIAREDAPGDTRLVAYVVPREAGRDLAAELREQLQRQLPAYMVPAHTVMLADLPRTPNQKVDRKALPAPGAAAAPAGESPAAQPQTALEETIATAWRDVLKVPHVGVQDNFFDLGGHSLLAVQVHTRLKQQLARDLAITDLFRFPTIRALAGHLGRAADDPAAVRAGTDRAESRRAGLTRRQARRAN